MIKIEAKPTKDPLPCIIVLDEDERLCEVDCQRASFVFRRFSSGDLRVIKCNGKIIIGTNPRYEC